MRPFQDAVALLGEAVKPLAALHDGDAQFLFQLADAFGQGRLGDVAGLGCAGEVLLAGERG